MSNLENVIALAAREAAANIGTVSTPTEVWQEITIAIRRVVAYDRRTRDDSRAQRNEWVHGLATGIGVALICVVTGGAIVHILGVLR